MGSLNNGQPILKRENIYRVHHQGEFLKRTDTDLDTNTQIANSGTVRFTGQDMIGVAWQPGSSPSLSGLSAEMRNADNSVEREKFTVTGLPSGNLEHIAVRRIDIHTSISTREATNTLSPMETATERKVFEEGWTIFDGSGEAVGATNGTSDTDITPAATFAGASGETPV